MEEHLSLKLDKVIHQKARLGIMSILSVMEEAEFNYLKERLKLSDGKSEHSSQPSGKQPLYTYQEDFC